MAHHSRNRSQPCGRSCRAAHPRSALRRRTARAPERQGGRGRRRAPKQFSWEPPEVLAKAELCEGNSPPAPPFAASRFCEPGGPPPLLSVSGSARALAHLDEVSFALNVRRA